jgi:hypothetical protein
VLGEVAMTSTRKLLAAASFLALLVLLAIVLQQRELRANATPNSALPVGHVVVIAHGPPVLPSEVASQLNALEPRTVTTMADLTATLRSDDLLVIDSSALAEVPAGFLSAQLGAGRPILALNISASELDAKTGFVAQSAKIQPAWAQDTLPPKPDKPFFSFMLLKQVGNGWQRVVAQPLFSDGLFRAYMNQAILAAQDLTFIPSENGGEVVPLTDLDTPTSH